METVFLCFVNDFICHHHLKYSILLKCLHAESLRHNTTVFECTKTINEPSRGQYEYQQVTHSSDLHDWNLY